MSSSNYGLVEGPWGRFTFRKIQPQDWDKVIKHILDYFCRDEPTSHLLGFTDEYGEEFTALVKRLLLDDLSFWVEDNQSGEVAAVRVTFRHRKDTTFDGLSMNSKTLKELYRVVDVCHQQCDLFERYNLEEYADFFVASCAPKYRRNGITTEMYKRSLEFLAAEGFKLVKSVFTSPYSRGPALNLGFGEVARVDYTELKDDVGNSVFNPNDLNDEHYAVMLVKEL